MEQKKEIDVTDFFAEDRGGTEKFHMFNYMLDFAGQNEFVENLQIELFLKQFCALFTSYCLIYGIDADSLECDSTLMILFDMINAKLPDDIKGDYDTFYQYMVKYIV